MDITAIISLVSSIVNRVWPDKTETQKLQFAKELQEALAQADLAKSQLEVNKEEAANSNLFVSGARPFILWICGLSFAWQFLLQPIVVFVSTVTGHPIAHLPVFDYASLNTVLMGMLGLGAMRSWEKGKGVTK